jgi:hypothetical protein
MNVTIQKLIGTLARQERIDDWPPAEQPRQLRSFFDLPDIAHEEAERLSRSSEQADQLRELGARYRNREYNRVRNFFKDKPDQLGNEGKLLSLLAYLQIFRDNPSVLTRLEQYAAPLVRELVASEPSEFGALYEWFQNFIHGRPMPSAFCVRSSGCKCSNRPSK